MTELFHWASQFMKGKRMGKRMTYNCAYLRVNPIEPWPGVVDRRRWLATAQDLVNKIKRHCDIESVSIEHDIETVCEFCGCDWEKGNNLYNGGCCDKDKEKGHDQ